MTSLIIPILAFCRYRRPRGLGAAVGIVVTRAPWAGTCAVAAAGCACAGVAIRPSALRTSVSSLAMVSLLSLRNWRAFLAPLADALAFVAEP